LFTEILSSGLTKVTDATRSVQPRNANAITYGKPLDMCTAGRNPANDLRKINGWRLSSLGLLYYPSYIYNGMA
jgi:hypothetical protein